MGAYVDEANFTSPRAARNIHRVRELARILYTYANRVCFAKYICVLLMLRPGASRRLPALRPQPPPAT